MSAAIAPSWPPPMLKPGLAKCEPGRSDADREVTRWFAKWCRDQNISVRDLQGILHLRSIAVAHKKWSGEAAITLVDIKCFPRRFRHELFSMFMLFCDAADLQSLAHG